MPEISPEGLLPWQPAAAQGVLESLRCCNAALDGSDMGVGKTYAALAVVRALELPTLVVCPPIVRVPWGRAAKALGTEVSTAGWEEVRQGNTPFGRWEHPRGKIEVQGQCVSCQLRFPLDKIPPNCGMNTFGIHCIKPWKPKHNYGKFFWADEIKLLVFDEVHKAGQHDSLNEQMVIAARRQDIKAIALSGTPADSPLKMRALGYLLKLHSFTDFWSWVRNYNCYPSPFGGFKFTDDEARQTQAMERLRSAIFPARGVRVTTAEIPDFPECHVSCELYDYDDPVRINRLYEEMDELIRQINTGTDDMTAALQQLRATRQTLELLKVPLYTTLSEELMEQGFSPVIFVNYRRTINELCRRFPAFGRIDGSQVGDAGFRQRMAMVDEFQANVRPGMIANCDAGGVGIGLHDLTGKNPRYGLVNLPLSSVSLSQLLARLPRAGGKSPARYRIPLFAKTPEEKIHESMQKKLNARAAFVDGDLNAANLPLTRGKLSDLMGE